MAELKPCDCGVTPQVYCVPTLEFSACAVVCKCGKQTPLYFDKEAAIDAWNRREK